MEQDTPRSGRPPGIAVIVVNYGTAELAIEAVDSVLARAHGGRTVEVHLVDNASPGDDAARLSDAAATRGWAGRVTLHLEQVNHGFGRGNNLVLEKLAARETPPDKVMLLNPDARLENEAVAVLAGFLDGHPGAGLAGARISKPDAGPVTAAFRFPSLASEIQNAAQFGPLSRLLGRWTVALPPDIGTRPVDWVAGAAVMFRFAPLAAAGFFDPDYFLYYEEVDLMRRLGRAGWQAWYVAEAHVIHVEGAATQVRSNEAVRPRRPDYWYESRRMYFEKNHGRGYALLTGGLVMLSATMGRGLSALRGRPSALPRDFLSDYRRLVVRPLLGRGRKIDPPATLAPAGPAAAGPERNDGRRNRNPAGIGFWPLVREDLETHYGDPLAQGFWALFWHRFGNWRMAVRPKFLRAPLTVVYRVMAKICEWVCGIYLPYTVVVGRRVRLEHFGGMILVAEAIGNDVVIRQNTTFGIADLDHLQERPVIGDGVEIGAGAVIVGGIEIGPRTVIGANAVVARSMPADAVVGGVPAKVLRPRRSDETRRGATGPDVAA